jgi:hypothetical protein
LNAYPVESAGIMKFAMFAGFVVVVIASDLNRSNLVGRLSHLNLMILLLIH